MRRARQTGGVSGEWLRYWRCADRPVEAPHARFNRHVYHRHSHETYSFGVTDAGVQECRGAGHRSTAGMVMAFNPDDPHDGRPGDELGFVYRIVHIGPELVARALAATGTRRPGLPLFAEPVVRDPVLAGGLRRLHASLLGPAPALVRDELLDAVIVSAVRRAATRDPGTPGPPPGARVIARRARNVLAARFAEDLTAARRRGPAGSPSTAPSAPSTSWPPATTSVSSACARPAATWPRAGRSRRRPPWRGSPTRAT